MKTRLNNKGYSLVELMLTLFIFGIVMVGIGMIMRTTTVSYKDGNAEVTMQTEAQIIANQVEELLVDATSVSGKTTLDADRYYYAIFSNGATHNVMFNGKDNRMYYQQGAINDAPEDWMLMAEYVSSFNIIGLSTDPSSADCDNMVTVKINMDKSGYNYSTVKEVYFRNDLENKSVQLIGGAAPGPVDPDDEFTGTIVVDRYQIIDLEKEYNIDVDTIGFSPNFGTDYRFLTAKYSSDNEKANKIFVTSGVYAPATSVDEDDNPEATAFITTSVTRNGSFDTSVDESDNYWISGTTHDGDAVKYRLTTPVVSYKVDGTGGGGALMLSTNDGDPGRDNWVEVEGINFCHMVEYPVGGIAMQLDCKFTVYDDSRGTIDNQYDAEVERQFQFGSNSNEYRTAVIETKSLTSADTIYTKELIDMPCKIDVGVRIDPMTGDLSIIQGNNPTSSCNVVKPGGTVNIATTGDLRYACSITVSQVGSTSTVTPTVIDMGIVIQADNDTFAGYTGGKSYAATTSLWD